MRLLRTLVTLTVLVNVTLGRCKRPRPGPVMGTLQGMLSPANAERTMQMLKVATQQTFGNAAGNCNLQPQIPVSYSPSILPLPEPSYPINLPISMPNLMTSPIQMPVQASAPIPITPIQVPMTNPISYQISSSRLTNSPIQMPVQIPSPPIQMPVQMPSPPIQVPVQMPSPPIQMPVQMPSPPIQVPVQMPSPPLQTPYQVTQLTTIPPEITLQKPCEREILYPAVEIPSCIYNPEFTYPNPDVLSCACNPPLASDVTPIALTSAQDIYSCPIPSAAALFTLPAACPCSSCAQGCSGSRSQFLRKIPIPPPTL